MTRRICVLGNSHTAALKGGWESGGGRPGLVPDFFGALSSGMASLAFSDGQLLPQDPEAAAFFRSISGTGKGAIAADYDAFLLCGMGLFPVPVFQNYSRFATPSTRNSDAPHYVSDACIDDLLWDHIGRSMMLHCARLVRQVTDAPVFLAWQAFYAETLFDIEWRAAQMTPILENGDQPYVLARMKAVEDRLAAEGFQILHQPPETLAQGIMTRAEFSRGSVLFRQELTQQHRANDVFHMNSDYGARCWQAWDI